MLSCSRGLQKMIKNVLLCGCCGGDDHLTSTAGSCITAEGGRHAAMLRFTPCVHSCPPFNVPKLQSPCLLNQPSQAVALVQEA